MMQKFQEFNLKYRGSIAVFGGFLIHIILGSLYLWGAINGYVSSYFQNMTPPQKVTVAGLNAVFPLIFQSGGLATMLTEKAMKVLGIQWLCLLCSVMMSGAVFVSSFAMNAVFFSIFYGIIYGFFQGLVLYAPIYNGYLYFPEKKGMVTGIIAAGFGFGNLILSQVAFALINPDNVKVEHGQPYPKEVTDHLPNALRILSLIYICVLCLGTLLVRPPIIETEEQRIRIESAEETSVISNSLLREEPTDLLLKKPEEEKTTTFLEAMKTPYPYIMFIQAWALTSVGMVVSNNYKQYGDHFDDYFLTNLGSITSVFNAIGRPLWGTLMDYVKFRYLVMLNLTLQVIIASTIQYSTSSMAFYSIWILLVYLLYGGSYAMMVPACVRVYGAKSGKMIYRFVYQGFCLQSWTQFLIVRYTFDDIGYDNIFYIYAGLAGLGLVISAIPLRSKIDNKPI